MSNFTNGASLQKLTTKRTIVSSKRIVEGFNPRSINSTVARTNDQLMSEENIQILEDFGFDTTLNKSTRAPLSSLDISKLRKKHIINVLGKEPHEKTNKEVEELRKILAEIPYFQNYVTSTEKKLNTQDLNDLSKILTYQMIEAGEEVQLFGEKSNQMYIILKGKVALARPKKVKDQVTVDQMIIEGTFQTQIKKQGTKRLKLNKTQSQYVAEPIKKQITYNGIPCRFFVTVDEVDEMGNIQKVKQPHPIYNEVAEMQKVLQNLKALPTQVPAFREKLEKTIRQSERVTASEQAFQQKLTKTMNDRREREYNQVQRQQETQIERHHTHQHHLMAHTTHIERMKVEEDHVKQMVFHNNPTIIQRDSQSISKFHRSGNVTDSNEFDSLSDELNDDPSKKSIAIQEFQEETVQSVALAITDGGPNLDTDKSVLDEDLPLDYDDQECPTEEIFDYLSAGQYFGQLSLLDNSPSKKASVYTKTKVHLIIIDKIAFERMLVLHLKRHETELLSFLKTIPLLKTFPNSQLKKLVGYFAPVNKIIHSFVYKENTPSTHVYIVKEGEFRVTRRVSKEQVKNEQLPKDVYDDPLKSMKGQSKYFVKNIATQYETIELQTIGKCQLIGDEDCAMSEKYNTTVQCISQTAKLLVMSREDFRKLESQSILWTKILNNGEQKIRRYHEKMRQFKYVQQHVEDEMTKARIAGNSTSKAGKKFIAGEDLLQQHRDSIKRPSGEMIENPIFATSRLDVNLEDLITRRVPNQILSTKHQKQTETDGTTSHKNLKDAFSSLQLEQNRNQGLEKARESRRVSTGVPHARNLRLQTMPVNSEEKSAVFNQLFQKYKSPSHGGRSQQMVMTTASSKAPRNVLSFSTANALETMNPRKLQTTAYLKLKENFKTRPSLQSGTAPKNIKYSMSWNLSPTQNQPPNRLPIDLNNVI